MPFLLLSLSFIALEVGAAGLRERDTEPSLSLADSRPTYRVAVLGVVTTTHNRELRLLLGTLSGQVENIVRSVEVRVLSETERKHVAMRVRQDRVVAIEREIATTTVRSDTNRLLGTGASQDNTPSQTAELRSTRAALSTVNLEKISVPDAKPVEVVDRVSEVLPRLANVARKIEEDNADLVLYLSVDSADEYLVVTVLSANRYETGVSEVCRAVALPEEIGAALEACRPALISYVSGGRYGELAVRVFDSTGAVRDDAALYLDAKFVGNGSQVITGVAVGEREVTAQSPRGASVRKVVTVNSDSRSEAVLVLPAAVLGELTLRTQPDGADVYRGVEWIGKAPVTVPTPDTPVQFAFRSPGYLEGRAMSGDKVRPGDSEIEKRLIEDSYDWEADFDHSRRSFYRAFGFFLGSVAVPIVLNGIYQDYFGIFPNGVIRQDIRPDDQDLYTRRANMVFYGYYGSLGVSTLFLGNLVWRLADYIRVGQGYHTR